MEENKFDFNQEFKEFREKSHISPSGNYDVKHSERITVELLDLNRIELEKEHEATERLIAMLTESNKSNSKLSKAMLGLTIATVFLAIVQIAIAFLKK